jgi:AcrR family transcriptional regulator
VQNKTNMDAVLAESFMEIAKKKPIEKITIKEITDRAGVIRPTFYNHFQDKYEVIEWLVKHNVFGSTEVLMKNGMVNEAVILVFKNLIADKAFYMKASKLAGQNSFEHILEKCIKETFEEYFFSNNNRNVANHIYSKWITADSLSGYYANILTYVLTNWIQGGMMIPPEDMAKIFHYIETRSLQEMLEELKE